MSTVSSKPRILPNIAFQRLHGKWAQDNATATREATDLFRSPEGFPRLVLSGWPCQGTYLGTYGPQPRQQEGIA